SLANSHNLFGRCHEVIVRRADEEGVIMGSQGIDFNEQVWLEVKAGFSVQDMLAEMDYDVESITQMIRDRHLGRETTLGQPWATGRLHDDPYLVRTRRATGRVYLAGCACVRPSPVRLHPSANLDRKSDGSWCPNPMPRDRRCFVRGHARFRRDPP